MCYIRNNPNLIFLKNESYFEFQPHLTTNHRGIKMDSCFIYTCKQNIHRLPEKYFRQKEFKHRVC